MDSIPSAAMLEGSFILATSAIHLITVVPVCLLGLTQVKVTLNTLTSTHLIFFDQESKQQGKEY